MAAILFKSDGDPAAPWAAGLREAAPGLEFRAWPDLGDPDDVAFALVWQPPGEALLGLRNLRLIFSLGAGLDHLLGHPGLPEGVPIVRLVDPALTEGMCEYVVMHVLRLHRAAPRYEAQQRARVWRPLSQVRPRDRRVGIMGLGVLGRAAAAKLAGLDFRLAGWSRTRKRIEGVECFSGSGGLVPFLARTEILVCLLPLTADTEGIIDRRTLAALPRGACVINAARGGHVDDAALLDALDSGHVEAAVLDVFREEPLPAGHRFWTHPRITLTPHVASLTNPATAARRIADDIRRFTAGEPLLNVVDRERGY